LASKSLCIFLSLLFLVARVLAAPNDEEDVRKTVGGCSQSWNRHDIEAFGKLFATEADFVNVAGDRWKGRAAIQAQHAYSHGTIPSDTKGFEALRMYYGIFKTSTIRFTEIDVRFLRRHVALARASWEMLGDTRLRRAATRNRQRGELADRIHSRPFRALAACAQKVCVCQV